MKEKVPKMCITCQHYEPFQCTLTDDYIGYLYCDVPRKCAGYRLSDDYKRGGRFYDSRPDKVADRKVEQKE